MTQENQPDSTETTDLTSNPDLLLMLVVNLAEELEINIMLFVQGTIIGGVLISEKAYFENFKKDKSINFGNQLQQDRFNKLLDNLKSFATETLDDQEKVPKLTNIEYIHLKDAKICSANTLTPNSEGFYWRGRLSNIDGFSVQPVT